MLKITPSIALNETEIEFTYIRASGPGGQNVNKVATAVQLRFDLLHSSLPESIRTRLIKLAGTKINQKGEIILKGSQFRTQERNKQDALERLIALIKKAAITPKKRKKTKPTAASTQRRLTKKKLHGKIKSLRQTSRGNDYE